MQAPHTDYEQEAGRLDNDEREGLHQLGNDDVNQEASADTDDENDHERPFLALECLPASKRDAARTVGKVRDHPGGNPFQRHHQQLS
jgi:hypothetical protein